jgi:hypothetical protein
MSQGRSLIYFLREQATKEQCGMYCGFVGVDDEPMKVGLEDAQQGQMICFTNTIMMSEFVVNARLSSSNLCTLSLPCPSSLVPTVSILKVPGFGGKGVSLNALDFEDCHVCSLLFWQLWQYDLLGDCRISKEA